MFRPAPLFLLAIACQPELTHSPSGVPIPDSVRVIGQLPDSADVELLAEELQPGQFELLGDGASGALAVVERVDPDRVGTFSSAYVACPDCNRGSCDAGYVRNIEVGLNFQGGTRGAHVTTELSSENFSVFGQEAFNAVSGPSTEVAFLGTLNTCGTFSYRFDVEACPATVITDLFRAKSGTAATVQGDRVVLTPNSSNLAGGATGRTQLDWSHDFSFTYRFYVGDDEAGAEGISFLFHNDPEGSTDVGTGAGEGYGLSAIQRGLAVVVDTASGSGGTGPDYLAFFETDADLVLARLDLPDLEDDGVHDLVISWNATTNRLSARVDGLSELALNRNVPTLDLNAATTRLSRISLTASTGAAFNEQWVQLVSADAVFTSPDVLCF